MADDKTVSVVLEAKVTGFKAQLAQASAAVKKAGVDMAGSLDAATKKSVKFQSAYKSALDTRHILAFDIAGAALVGTLGLAVAKAASFEKSLSTVKAVTNATAGEMTQLRQAALDAGQASVFTASESADAIGELAKAGVSTANILGGALTGALNLAAAGGLGLADAATIAAQSMNTFGLQGKDVTHIADVLAAGANKSAADVETLALAMRQGGLVAAQTGLSFEDTAGVLSLFADNALVGSDAGTSLKTMLQRLTPQSKQAQREFDRLGISAYDAQGNFVGLDNFAQQLHDKLGALTPQARNAALSVMFGSDAVRAASVLYNAGAKGVDEYTKAVNDHGAAARMAAEQTNNLAGDIERLRGSMETALIKGGSGFTGMLRDLTQSANQAVDAVAGLPDPVNSSLFGLAGLAGAALLAIPRLAALKAASNELNLSFGGLTKATSVATLAVAGLAAAGKGVAALEDQLGAGATSLDEWTARLSGANVAMQDLVDIRKQMVGFDTPGLMGLPSEGNGFLDFLSQISRGDILGGIAALHHGADEVGNFDQALANLAGSGQGKKAAAIVDALGLSAEDAARELPLYSAAITASGENIATTMQHVITSTAGMAAQMDAATASYQRANAVWSRTDKLIALREAEDGLTKALKANGHALDTRSAKGRANLRAAEDLAKATIDAAVTLDKEGNVLKVNNGRLEEGANKLFAFYKATGMTDTAAEKATEKILGFHLEIKKLPNKHTTKLTVDTSQARHALSAFEQQWASAISSMSQAALNAHFGVTGLPGGKRATGGPVVGPGTGTSDNVPIWASNGEYVVRASSVAKYGTGFFDALNAGHYASGGKVRKTAAQRVEDQLNRRGQRALDYGSGVRGGVMDFGGLSDVYDPQAEADALKAQASAATELANAQDLLNKIRAYKAGATDPKARAQATALEADAQQALAAATGKLASADQKVAAARPSATNLLQAQAAKIKTVRQFVGDMKKLSGMGLSKAVLADLWSKGPDEGGPMAHELVAGGKAAVGTANRQQAELSQLARRGANLATQSRYGVSSAEARAMAGVRISVSGNHFHFPAGTSNLTKREVTGWVDDAIHTTLTRISRQARRSK